MCGIVGYVGKRSAQDVLLDGLEKLEYRGYDSAGVALALDGGIRVVKSKGRLTLEGIAFFSAAFPAAFQSRKFPRCTPHSCFPAGRAAFPTGSAP